MQSFRDFASTRAELLRRADHLESTWRNVRAFTADTDQLVLDDEGHRPTDLVADAVEQVRARLRSSTIEVGVFGDVNRGKSTLLNALLGVEVSSMRVTPETAVPVWVERGRRPSEVLYAGEDGKLTRELVEDPKDARDLPTQRWRKKSGAKPISRVVQYVDVEWLEEGVRFIDTPGLNDPSLIDDYQELTLAELDRVAAAILVFVSPPGIARDEVQLLRSLGDRGVDKAFLVCNFYGEQWDSPDDRAAVVEHVIQSVVAGAEGVLHDDDVQVFEVNARRGLRAALSHDVDGFEESGVADLRAAIEAYLTEGALTRLTYRAEDLLQRGHEAVEDVLRQRIDVLTDSEALHEAVDRHRRDVARAEQALEAVKRDCADAMAKTEKRLTEIVTAPYESASTRVTNATKVKELDNLGPRLSLEVETAASRASTFFAQDITILEERMRRQVHETFGVEQRVAERRGLPTSWQGPSESLAVGSGSVSWGAVGAGAAATAVAGSLIGGSLAGGIGVALIALGPVGWAVGAGIGLLAGGVLGAGSAGLITSGSIRTEQRSTLLESISRQRRMAVENLRQNCEATSQHLIENLSSQRDAFFGDQADELERANRILKDEALRQRAVREAERLLAELASE